MHSVSMKKFSLIAVFLALGGVFLLFGCAVDGVDSDDAMTRDGEVERVGVAEEALTCDLLSGLGVDNSACAAHCIFRNHKGGYCDDRGVCNCRD